MKNKNNWGQFLHALVVENKKNAELSMVYMVKNLITISYVILNIQINKIRMHDFFKKKLMRNK